jgi:hypothetical protein
MTMVDPVPCATVEELAETCLAELEQNGFVLVPGFLTGAEVAAGRASFERLAPTPEEFAADGPGKYALLAAGDGGTSFFPAGTTTSSSRIS